MVDVVNFALSQQRYAQVCEWQGEKRIDLREWNNNIPTKKGISLTLLRWKCLVDNLDKVDEALINNQSYSLHLGGNVYCKVRESNPCVDIRKYWKPEEEIVPTRKGLCMRPREYLRLKEIVADVGAVIPELDGIVPCQFQSDHANQMGMLRCSECNPNDYTNW